MSSSPPPALSIRRAQLRDSELLLQWRNDPVTRSVSVNTDEVSWADHQRWYESSLKNPNRFLLIGELDAEPIGMVRFDARDDAFEVSINLAPTARGRGLGVALLEAGREWLTAHTTATEIVAIIREDNTASVRAFTKAGYSERSHTDGFLTYVR